MKFYKGEWLRVPFSNLERTLRLPYLIKFSIVILLVRILIPVIALVYFFWIFIKSEFLTIPLSVFLVLFFEICTLKNLYLKKILRKNVSNVVEINNKKLSNLTSNELVKVIEKSVEKSSWGIINIGYVGFASFAWEIIFKFTYPIFTRDQEISYKELFTGLESKSNEADQALWEVSQEKSTEERKRKLKTFLENYGSRVQDLDLAFPTLREKPQVIASLIKLYSVLESPSSRLVKVKEDRMAKLHKVLENTNIPRSLFLKYVNFVTENIRLREDRRFYEFSADYNIRQMIITLSDKLEFSPGSIFNMNWRDIKNEANKRDSGK